MPPPSAATQAARAAVVQSGLSRQAIYDAKLRVWAYELQHTGDGRTSMRSDDTTSTVILSAFAEFGLARVVGERKAFISASAGTLMGQVPLPIPSRRVTLEVRDYEYSVAELVDAIRRRKDEGFSIALKDFVFTESIRPLLDIADFVMLDVSRHSVSGLREQLTLLEPFAVQSIATGLQNSAQVRACESMGFHFYQGDFLFKPQVLQRKELPSSFVVISDLLAKLEDPDVEFTEIEELVKRDAALSVAVLRFLNSSAYGFRQKVSSVRQAVALLGLKDFAKWALLVVMSARFEKPSELLTTALIRARTCELLAQNSKCTPSTAFMIGLLSPLDALLDAPMAELLDELPVADEVRLAILEFSGPEGQVLEKVMMREHTEALELSEQEQQELTSAWLDALEWADKTRGALG